MSSSNKVFNLIYFKLASDLRSGNKGVVVTGHMKMRGRYFSKLYR